jgi:hypothetical protein
MQRPYEQDPDGFNQEALAMLREHFPAVHARVNPEELGVTGPMEHSAGAVRPFRWDDVRGDRLLGAPGLGGRQTAAGPGRR